MSCSSSSTSLGQPLRSKSRITPASAALDEAKALSAASANKSLETKLRICACASRRSASASRLSGKLDLLERMETIAKFESRILELFHGPNEALVTLSTGRERATVRNSRFHTYAKR